MEPKYQVMPALSDEEYEALKTSIAKAGRLFNPIIKDADGNIIDGHNRARALEELGIPNDHRVGETHLRDLSESEARMLARRLNLGRRHLSREQIAQVVRDVKAEHPRWSANKISAELGGMPSDVTVASILKECPTSKSSKLDTPAPKTEGRDQKARPATRKATAQQRDAISAALQREPARSDRSVAKDLGCSPSTVGAVRSTIATNTFNGNGQPRGPEKAAGGLAGVISPPDSPADPADRRDAVEFAKELEGVLARALMRRPEAFVELLPPKRQDVLLLVLDRFCAWAQAAQTGDFE